MKKAGLCVLFLSAHLACFADMGVAPNMNEQLSKGSTKVTIDSYHVKITAEQRRSDRKVQIVVIPEQQGVWFHIQGVQFAASGPHGAVAKVSGSFTFRESNARNGSVRRMVEVEVAPVNEFSISADEARLQGNICFQRDLPRMLTED